MPGLLETNALHHGVDLDGRKLGAADREKLLKPYLPTPLDDLGSDLSPGRTSKTERSIIRPRQSRLKARRRLGAFIRSLIHHLLYFFIQLVFTIFIRIRQVYHAVHDRLFSVLYYHHRTPELIQRDIKNLSRLPKHLSVILELREYGHGSEAESLAKLIEDVSEIAAWCACAGIHMLSVYEQTGILKSHIPALHQATSTTFNSYFPPTTTPTVHIRAPHLPSQSPPPFTFAHPDTPPPQEQTILLLSASDGRATLVDLTKTLAEMAQQHKLAPADITDELIDAEIAASVCPEPDLLVVMAGNAQRTGNGPRRRGRSKSRRGRSVGRTGDAVGDVATEATHEARDLWSTSGGDVCLRGYPPWQVRLTEIFHVQDNTGVGYQIFLRALYRYAQAEMRFGR